MGYFGDESLQSITCTGTVNLTRMKRITQRMQTLRAGCSKAEPNIFAPPQTPFPGVRDGQNLISWRWSLPLPTNPVWLGSMHAISSYRGNRPPHTHTHKQTEPITIHCAAVSTQCNNQKTEHTINTMQKVALVYSTKHTLRKRT